MSRRRCHGPPNGDRGGPAGGELITPGGLSPDGRRPAVRCRALVKRYPDVVAVAGIDLEVWPGECLGLLGPNGAGKTTTVEILEGLTAPDAGDVEVLGERWGQGRDRALRERLGVQLHETILGEKLTVEETARDGLSRPPSSASTARWAARR